MTPTPQPPQMPPREPLDASERELARALRNLPVGAPPPELDARILGAARRAVHLAQPPKRDRRWLVGLGTAASALLAIGVLVKTHGPGEGAVYTQPASTTTAAATPATEPSNAPAAAAAAPPAEMQDKKKESPEVAADVVAPSGNASPMPAAMPAQRNEVPERQQAEQVMSNPEAAAAKQAPMAFPAAPPRLAPEPAARAQYTAPAPPPTPPAPPIVTEEAMPMSSQAMPPPPPAPSPPVASRAAPAKPVDERAESTVDRLGIAGRNAPTDATAAPVGGSFENKSVAAAPAPAAPAVAGVARAQPAPAAPTSSAMATGALKADQAASGSMDAAAGSKAANLDSVTATGGRVRKVDTGQLPPVEDDAKLPPVQWIERIRARVNAADGNDARKSLRRYRLHYPDAGIPDDLQPLLH